MKKFLVLFLVLGLAFSYNLSAMESISSSASDSEECAETIVHDSYDSDDSDDSDESGAFYILEDSYSESGSDFENIEELCNENQDGSNVEGDEEAFSGKSDNDSSSEEDKDILDVKVQDGRIRRALNGLKRCFKRNKLNNRVQFQLHLLA